MGLALHVYLAGAALLWLGAFLRAVHSRQDDRYSLGAEDPRHPRGDEVVVLVPARDEAEVIERCVLGVLAQDLPGLRVVVLNDGSTDSTGEILDRIAAQNPRLSVLHGDDLPPPEGWLGKPYACQRAGEGALEGSPDLKWMLFLDADVYLEPNAVAVAVGFAEGCDADLVSALGNLELRSFWERVFQPVVAGLILAGNDLSKINQEDRPRRTPLANGQFLLFRREAWEGLGGHQAVASNVLDDVGLAQAVVEKGMRYRLVFMPSLFRVRMYDSFRSMWSGWSKNLFAGLGYSWMRLLWVVLLIVGSVLLPLLCLVLALVGLLDTTSLGLSAAAVASMFSLRAYLDHVFKQDLRYVPTLPLGSVLLVALLINSALQTRWGRRVWKGRVLDSTS